MRIYKSTYRDRHGKTNKTSKWYVEITDHNGDTRRVPAFTSRSASEEFANNLKKLVAYHQATGGQVDPDLQEWLNQIPSSTRKYFLSIGLLNAERVAVSQALSLHVDDYAKALKAKGNTDKHVNAVKGRIVRILDACQFNFWHDIDAAGVQTFLSELRESDDENETEGLSAQTSNYYLASLKAFCRWMVRERRASSSPVSHLDPLNPKTDRRLVRRALPEDELHRLMKAAQDGEELYGRDRDGVIAWRLTGMDRAMLYRLAVETGLRVGEIRSLTPRSFDLDAEIPVVKVMAAYSKHRRDDTLPLRPATAFVLNEYLMERELDKPLFSMPRREELASILRVDLAAAGIEDRNAQDQVVDFHALRHTFITNLASGGIHPKLAQTLARHSTITLTMDRYSHTQSKDVANALNVLPNLRNHGRQEPPKNSASQKQNGQSVLADCWAQNGGLADSPCDSVRLNRDDSGIERDTLRTRTNKAKTPQTSDDDVPSEQSRARGGTGRRSGLKIRGSRKGACGFDSRRAHCSRPILACMCKVPRRR